MSRTRITIGRKKVTGYTTMAEAEKARNRSAASPANRNAVVRINTTKVDGKNVYYLKAHKM